MKDEDFTKNFKYDPNYTYYKLDDNSFYVVRHDSKTEEDFWNFYKEAKTYNWDAKTILKDFLDVK